jgi:endogenous inhibitor of DNA gyrase (YacG/DUF329 family)
MAASSREAGAGSAHGRCPICGALIDPEMATSKAAPFCSKRCADVDLARWLSGSYVIQGGHEDADEDGDQAAAERAAAPSRHEDADEDR